MSLLLAIAGATEAQPSAAQPKRRRRLRWREYENLPAPLREIEQESRPLTPNELADATEFELQQESTRLATLLAAAKIEQENARQRALAAELAQQIELARRAMNEAIAAAALADRIAQEIEEIDVAYITAMVLND